MKNCGLVKKEPKDNECYEAESDYCSTLENLKFVKEEPGDNGFYEATPDFHSAFDSEKSRHVKLEIEETIVKVEEECQDAFLPTIIPAAQLLSEENAEEPNRNLKSESVELETLTESTLVQSPGNNPYALPWDFVSMTSIYDRKSSKMNTIKTELDDGAESGNLSAQKYEGRMYNELFTCRSSMANKTSEFQNTRILKEKFIQQTSNVNCKTESVELETLNENTLMQSSKDYRYASPWDFISVKSTCDQSSFEQNTIQKELGYQHLSENMIEKEYEDGNHNKLFKINHPVSNRTAEIKSTKVVKKKLIQPTLNFHSVFTKHSKNPNTINKDSQKLSNSDVIEHDNQERFQYFDEYLNESNLTRHDCDKLGENNPGPTQNHECNKTIKLKNPLSQHLERHNHTKYSCDNCPNRYSHKSRLRKHMNVHKTEFVKIDQPIEEPLKLYECDVCGKRFDKKSSIKVHIEFLHLQIFSEDTDKPQSRSNEPSRLVNSLKKRFQCHICRKKYTQKSHLYRHQECHQATKSHFCELCNQYFTATSSLTRHLLKKHGEIRSKRKNATIKAKESSRDFSCKICGRSLTSLADLRRHCATHDGRKPFECDLCKKQFAVKGYLYAHILTHDNWQPYPCKSCSKVYRRKSSLHRHVDISHSKKEKYKCNICSKSYKHEASYRKHVESLHQ